MVSLEPSENEQEPLPEDQAPFPPPYPSPSSGTLKAMIDALDVMQSEYFSLWQATWPSGIDWTKAVVNTHIPSVLSLMSSTLDTVVINDSAKARCDNEALSHENLISYYFQQTTTFWHGENFFGIRLQAYDDMLWVVLEWLESIKLQNLHSELHFGRHPNSELGPHHSWHGTQYRIPAAHRARVFYDLAARGWDTLLCGGGMIWSPWLTPYKNAITNELFISASVAMYLYFPGDTIDSPIVENQSQNGFISPRHNPVHRDAAITAYKWLKNSNMTGANGLYGDGFHIRGWGPKDPGTGNCDVLNTMVYTYNQGVILSGLRGLWLATGLKYYLEDGHELVRNVIKATGWPEKSNHTWHGLGRAGVLEEACDSTGICSQDGQTFKGIFFHHFAEFCRQLSPQEKRMLSDPKLYDSMQGDKTSEEGRREAFRWHQRTCASYLNWLEHNAHAASVTKNENGLYGMWWGRKYADMEPNSNDTVVLPHGAVDYSNAVPPMNRASPDLASLQAKGNRTNLAKDEGGDITEGQLLPVTNADQDSTTSQFEGGVVGTDAQTAKVLKDVNDRGRGRTLETQSGALSVFKALYQWETTPSLMR
ncbi:uncharacterized protein GIQ15_03178 [Arthroderma uncinatum]|uniref:uncharacterized protein n=1 Tax=Arthroderma uncinatum TaxID=74035 RepID=UPI00144A5A6D|nr:uncharacterized protein GIQ15_03178 [Arthroderma uncinatum]KAF3483854.1 hypothetical protein GIQ15_03178 [Arthroderma uncinatum]